MRHCIHQWLLQSPDWGHEQGLTTLHKQHTHWIHDRHQWCVVKKLGKILVLVWRINSRPDQSKYQCTMMVWGTVFTNDCCSRLVAPMTKVWQPFTSNIHTHWEHARHQWCVVKKLGKILVQMINSRYDQSKYQCTMIIWGTVFTNDCCSRLVMPMTKVWQPFTSNIHTENMPDINDVWDFGLNLKDQFAPWPE